MPEGYSSRMSLPTERPLHTRRGAHPRFAPRIPGAGF